MGDDSGCRARHTYSPVVQAELVEVQPLERLAEVVTKVSTKPQSSLPLLL